MATLPIQDLIKEGQEVLVQVAKDPISTKGARVDPHHPPWPLHGLHADRKPPGIGRPSRS